MKHLHVWFTFPHFFHLLKKQVRWHHDIKRRAGLTNSSINGSHAFTNCQAHKWHGNSRYPEGGVGYMSQKMYFPTGLAFFGRHKQQKNKTISLLQVWIIIETQVFQPCSYAFNISRIKAGNSWELRNSQRIFSVFLGDPGGCIGCTTLPSLF